MSTGLEDALSGYIGVAAACGVVCASSLLRRPHIHLNHVGFLGYPQQMDYTGRPRSSVLPLGFQSALSRPQK